MAGYRYLLDTNIVSDAMRNPQGAVRRKLDEIDEAEIYLSVIVLYELRYGVRKRNSDKLAAHLEEILSAVDVRFFSISAICASASAEPQKRFAEATDSQLTIT